MERFYRLGTPGFLLALGAAFFIGHFVLASASCSLVSVLKIGDAGLEVRCLQEKVGVNPDGKFGPLTYAAVVAFQETHGLKTDGVVGPLTRAALGETDRPTTVSQGCTPGMNYDPMTGKECRNDLTAETDDIKSANSSSKNDPNTQNSPVAPEKKSSSPEKTNPNLRNLEAYIAAVKDRSAKGGLSDEKISYIEAKIRKQAADDTDFLQEFFDKQQAFYKKKASADTPASPLFSVLDRALSFVGDAFAAKKAAAMGLAFGGYVTYVNPVICDCPPGITQLFVGGADYATSNFLLNYIDGSQAFASYNLPEPSIAVKGLYIPAIPSCWTYVGTACSLIPSDGQITPVVGSSI